VAGPSIAIKVGKPLDIVCHKATQISLHDISALDNILEPRHLCITKLVTPLAL
jgi:hypothetical protein